LVRERYVTLAAPTEPEDVIVPAELWHQMTIALAAADFDWRPSDQQETVLERRWRLKRLGQ
jgi:hypothetical protein